MNNIQNFSFIPDRFYLNYETLVVRRVFFYCHLSFMQADKIPFVNFETKTMACKSKSSKKRKMSCGGKVKKMACGGKVKKMATGGLDW